jgi:hypothetical protein
MISVYQFSGMTQNLSDHLALTITGHTGTQLVVEELSDCIHTSFYFDNESLKNKILHHQKMQNSCIACSKSGGMKGVQPNEQLIEKLYSTNPAGAFALRRYRGEGNNRISDGKNILVASSSATKSAANSGGLSHQQSWKQVDYLSRIKWEVNIITKEDLEDDPKIDQASLNSTLFPSENSIINGLKTMLTRGNNNLGNCADTVQKVLSAANMHLSCILIRPGSLISACSEIAGRQYDFLVKNRAINLVSLSTRLIRNYSLASTMKYFLASPENQHKMNEYLGPYRAGKADLSCYLPSFKDWLEKLYGDLRGIQLAGSNEYRNISNLENYKSFIDGDSQQEPFERNCTTIMAGIGLSLP